MTGTQVKGVVEAAVVAVFVGLIAYCQVSGTPIDEAVMPLMKAILLGYFGFSAVEHLWRGRKGGDAEG